MFVKIEGQKEKIEFDRHVNCTPESGCEIAFVRDYLRSSLNREPTYLEIKTEIANIQD